MVLFWISLPTLYLTYSLIVGLGFGMMYIPAIVAVASHFKTRRALALGRLVKVIRKFFLKP